MSDSETDSTDKLYYRNRAEIIELIENCTLGVWIELEHLSSLLKRIKIEQEKDGLFSWTGEYSYKNAGTSGWTFPVRNNYVVHFKTLNGCKKNFLKRYTERWSFRI